MKNIIYLFAIGIVLSLSSCHDDLNQYPHEQETSETVFSKPENYISALAKCYASFVITGQEVDNNKDLSSNKGYAYYRNYINLQECGTDEIGSTWLEGDNTANISYLTWDANDIYVSDAYYRIYYTISLCNEFLKNATDGRIAGFTEAQQAEIRDYREEARFLRAFAYSHALDLFHDVPYADEATIGSSDLPEEIKAPALFNFLTTELKACSEGMMTAEDCEYGHAPRAAAWMLLSRLYLNSEVYGVEAKYDSCMIYSQKVLDEGYALEADYTKLFNADNSKRVGSGNEIIFSLVHDGNNVVSYDVASYLTLGQVDDENGYDLSQLGLETAWNMFRLRGNFTELFTEEADSRNLIYQGSNSQYMTNGMEDRTGGYFAVKWSNLLDDGTAAQTIGTSVTGNDFPVFRLAEAYLNYAEAAYRGGSNKDIALNYVNTVRQERGASVVEESQLAASQNGIANKFFLDERGREFYLEAMRRTDLIRFDCFTNNKYLWEWKGGAQDGVAVNNKYNIYPIPATEIIANPNLSNQYY
nr:RagB/SusD family nutrient uptake outer membrane protein [uncultured Carboxylicivirga sp.]